ncbi:MAG TPA: RHS repeat-associated core domain-containing protein [Longimicrobium sp.]|nr:RHS repeat-associated core domain-containing protein [Longimicrobium sp.]
MASPAIHARPSALLLALCLSVLPATLGAQQCTENPCESDPPQVFISPATGSYPAGGLGITVQFVDAWGVAYMTRKMTFNGADVTSQFTYNLDDTFTATMTLVPGTNTFSAYVCDMHGYCTTEYATYTAFAAGVRVTPDGAPMSAPASSRQVARFTVVNTGAGTSTYSLAPSCSGAAGCQASLTGATLAASDSAFVDVSFTAPASGNGVVRLTASAGGAQDEGSYGVAALAAAEPGYPYDARSMEQIERDACVVVGLGGGVANECGDLRVVHPLPGVRVLNRERAPALVYNHHHARPYLMAAAHVAPRAGTRPDTLRGYLTVGTTSAPAGRWAGWPSDTTKRVVVGMEAYTLLTGIYDYRLEVVAEWNGSATRDTLYRRTGKLVHVNRNGSPFGAGWWLAGVERVYPQAGDSLVLWVGGDGSARIYRGAAGGGTWTAHPFDRPETLRRVGSEYVRTLPGGAEVWFDGSGYHRRTVNRLGQVTEFVWNGDRLTSILLPNPPGQGDRLSYAFEYGGAVSGCATSTTGLTRVGAPAPEGGYRYTSLCADSARRVGRITDPDGQGVGFAYASTWLMTRRTDRRGGVATFGYVDRRLTVHRRFASSTDTLITNFSTGAGLGHGTATPVANVYLRVRNPLGHHTYFWLGRYGAPTRVQDAASRTTSLERGDPRWPAQVTRVVAHNGFETTASYDARGNLASSTAWNPYGDGRNATTTYAWDPVWDAVTQVVAPEGEVTLVQYDSVGRREWEQAGPSDSRRVTYAYYPKTHLQAPGLLQSVTLPTPPGATVATERFEYDARGNLAAVESPMGVRTESVSDRIGRVIYAKAPIDGTSFRYDSTFYDLADQVDSTVTRAGTQRLIVNNTQDEEGNLTAVSRRSDPDPASIGTVTTQWVYDLAGRRTVEIAPDGMRDSTVYDRAGNALEVHTRRTDATGQRLVIQNRYDAVNRVTHIITPAVQYNARDQALAERNFIMGWEDGASTDQPPPYPWYPNDGGSGYRIPADTALFTYHVTGGLLSATNRDAQVRRSYYPGGALRGDTLAIRTWADLSQGGNFTSHVYGLELTYDRNGRRTEIKHPSSVAPLAAGVLKDRTTYAFDRHTGALAQVTDPLGSRFRYHYNVRGELDSLSLPGGITEAYRYDLDGRLALHQTLNASSATDRYTPNPLRRDTLGYDPRGKLLFSRNGAGAADTLTAAYSPLGHLRSSRAESNGVRLNNAVPTSESIEEPRYDALGNQTYRRTESTFEMAAYGTTTTSSETFRYHAGTGRLRAKETPVHGDTLVYDQAGNLVWETYTTPGLTASDDFRDRAYFYDAAGRLRAADVRTVDDPTSQLSTYTRAFEEYRYDALGRRVLVRARRECEQGTYSALCELGWLRRTVWDGDQELIEIQAPGGQQPQYEQHMENDTAHVDLGMAVADPPDHSVVDPNPFYGRVLYVHGLSLDHPLGVVRMGYGDRLDTARVDRGYRAVGPYVLVPHWNSRGQAVLGTHDDGAWRRCEWLNGYKRCNFLQWAELWAGYARPRVRENAWHGTLLTDKGDGSGLNYRRNRYYDPASGRFTQEDPIGLAGGVNVYGFAAGDPVTYTDPYGLCPANQVQAPADPNEPERVCPGGLTHGEYYQREDGFWVAAPTAKNKSPREGSAEIGGQIFAWAQRDYLKGCSLTEFEISMRMGNTSRRMQRVTVGTWDMRLKRVYRDYYMGPIRIPRIDTGKYDGTYTSSNFPHGLDAHATVWCSNGWVFFHADADSTPDYQP